MSGTYNLVNPTSGGDITDVQQTLNTALVDISNAEVDISSLQANKVTGPASATNNALVRYDSTTGKLVKDSSVTVDDSGNMVISGDLTVQGTTTTVNSTTLEVVDKNILINNGGDDTSAQGAGVTVERSSVNGSIIYDSAVPTKWKVGNSGSEVEVLDKSTAQTVTNKTIVAANNTITTAASGNLTSVELNAALAELQGDIDALGSPSNYILKSIVTTKGDLIAATASATVSRLGVGTDGQVLTADSATATGLSWTTPSSAALSVVTKTSAYTATTSDRIIQVDATTASFNITLFSASGNSGLELTINKITSANAVTVTDGSFSVVLQTIGDSLNIYSDGSSWKIKSFYRPKVSVTYNTASAQSMTAATFTTINFNSLVTDTLSSVTTGAGWVFTAPRDDTYLLSVSIRPSAQAAGSEAQIYIYKNGAQVRRIYKGRNTHTAADDQNLQGSTAIPLSKGDTINFRGLLSTTQNLTNTADDNWVSINSQGGL